SPSPGDGCSRRAWRWPSSPSSSSASSATSRACRATFSRRCSSWWPGSGFSYPRSPAAPTSRTSLHDLISQQQDRLWDRHAERLGRLDIADQLERGRLPDGQVPRFRALQNAIDVSRRLPEEIGRLLAVVDVRDGRGLLCVVDVSRETLLHREIDDLW